ncbi:alpha-beta hydrolase superfamily lysophospholipase [Micromonospora kangleipakensis]|uniref:Alpha-beta hydrolase superfamily lysophospholipase n=1 Tax=Micromonospora kangleipakensis TaxID=1077942 RepID=A0A4Q8B3S8_9ACTN|nr:alpha/beta hydrolase [Micromonospora kangleipakensis]RZU72184.1 alpha-beta hydrolase superfamily lysophospholipase [Micromonospora kangleipakensis]
MTPDGTTWTVGSARSADGTAIAYETAGEGPPVILIGGAFNDRSTTRALAAALAADFTTYGYDRRGRGGSGDTAPYVVQREIEDVAALIEAAGGLAYVYGLSSGAILAAYAAAEGLPIAGLALFEPPFQVGPEGGPKAELSERLTELVAAGRRGDAVELFLTDAVGVPAEAVAGMRGTPEWSWMEGLAHTLAYDTTVTGDGTLPAARLATIATPTVVVDSAGSPRWLRDAAAATADTIPGATHRSLPGGFHEVPPEELAPAIRADLLG